MASNGLILVHSRCELSKRETDRDYNQNEHSSYRMPVCRSAYDFRYPADGIRAPVTLYGQRREHLCPAVSASLLGRFLWIIFQVYNATSKPYISRSVVLP